MRTGEFADGPDLMLSTPHLSAGQWHRLRLRLALHPTVVVSGLGSAGLVVLGGVQGQLTYLAAGVLLLLASVLVACLIARQALAHHTHRAPCRLDRRPGEIFYRSRDFDRTTAAMVWSLMVQLDELHRSPASAWLDEGLPRRAHRLVWQAVCWAERTSEVRALAEELTVADDALGRIAAHARRQVEILDAHLMRVAEDLDGCLVLTRIWETTLRQRELANRADRTLATLPSVADLHRLTAATEALQHTVFSYITAARDTIDAGRFPWEPTSQ